jgi:CheY-like chemotaxis protein
MNPPPKHILWVEDDEDNREVVTFFLERSGYRVTNAGTSVEALSLVQGEHFDLYLLGDWLPHGYESKLCEQIHQFDPRRPILFFSAAAYQADRQRGMDAGAQGYLAKPAGLGDLEQTISRLLDAASRITAD